MELEDKKFWLVGANWRNEGDMTAKFIKDGEWVNGYKDKYLTNVKGMQVGDLIAIKSSFVQKHLLPFNIGGKKVSAMRIKARGRVTERSTDGRHVSVSWGEDYRYRNWYFYTFRTTIVGLTLEDERARQLYDFIFHDANQDYGWWLSRPYFVAKYGQSANSSITAPLLLSSPTLADDSADDVEEEEVEEEVEEAGSAKPAAYGLSDIIAEGCFLPEVKLSAMLARWRVKKNLILQGRLRPARWCTSCG